MIGTASPSTAGAVLAWQASLAAAAAAAAVAAVQPVAGSNHYTTHVIMASADSTFSAICR
jgi:hypothetical protein